MLRHGASLHVSSLMRFRLRQTLVISQAGFLPVIIHTSGRPATQHALLSKRSKQMHESFVSPLCRSTSLGPLVALARFGSLMGCTRATVACVRSTGLENRKHSNNCSRIITSSRRRTIDALDYFRSEARASSSAENRQASGPSKYACARCDRPFIGASAP